MFGTGVFGPGGHNFFSMDRREKRKNLRSDAAFSTALDQRSTV